jgi:preprotein translocase subunit YajC
MGLLILPLLFAAMYFMTIRPQQQRLRNQRALVASLQAGDEIVTIGGLIGTVTVVGEQEIRLDVGSGNELRVARGAVQTKLSGSAEA